MFQAKVTKGAFEGGNQCEIKSSIKKKKKKEIKSSGKISSIT